MSVFRSMEESLCPGFAEFHDDDVIVASPSKSPRLSEEQQPLMDVPIDLGHVGHDSHDSE